MPHIPNAFTDSAPAAAVLGQSLYVAFKGHDSDRIYLASTRNPADSSSWRIVDVSEITASPKSPKDEPAQLRTSHGPALTSVGDYLWLTFKGHSNPAMWQVALRESASGAYGLLRFGRLDHAETAQDPAAAGPMMDRTSDIGQSPNPPMVVYRGNEDDHVWIHSYTLGTDSDVHLAGSITDFAPAVAYDKSGTQEARYLAYVDSGTHQVMFTGNYKPQRPHCQPGWQKPAPVAYGFTARKPALAVHDGVLFLAYKIRDPEEHRILISSWDGTFWVSHGSMRNMQADSHGSMPYVLATRVRTGQLSE